MSGSIPTHGPVDLATGAPIVEIVSAGNEVLIGDVLDTNTGWLCTRVDRSSAGWCGGRDAARRRRRHRRRAARLSGPAPGPRVHGRRAWDRRRRHARSRAAAGLDGGLESPPRGRADGAREVRRVRRRRLRAVRGDEREPPQDGAPAGRRDPLVNPVGGAPGVLMPRRRTTIVVSPRRARELMAIVDESLDEVFAGVFGAAHYDERSLRSTCRTSRRSPTSCARSRRPAPGRLRQVARQGPGARGSIRVTLSGAARRRRGHRADRAGDGAAAGADRRRRLRRPAWRRRDHDARRRAPRWLTAGERCDRPWWGHVADAVADEPVAAAVLVAAVLPLALGAAILALGRRLTDAAGPRRDDRVDDRDGPTPGGPR